MMIEQMLFTPKTKTGSRLKLYISSEDHNKIQRGNDHWTAEVTDIPTGRKFTVKGAACDLPTCYCDAVILKSQKPKIDSLDQTWVEARAISEGMRKLNPDAYNQAEKSVSKNMQNPKLRKLIRKAARLRG